MNLRTPLHRWSAAAVCALLLISPLAAQPAVAAPAETAANWWYDLYDVAAVHAEGWTGEGVKVAVIDAQINPDLPVFAGQSLTVADGGVCAGGTPTTTETTFDAIHGSTVTATIIGNGTGAGAVAGIAPGADVTFYGWGELSDDVACAATEYPESLSPFGWAIQRAVDDGARIITTSVSTSGLDGDADVIANALAKGIVVIVATSNPSPDGVVWLGTNGGSSLNGVVAATAVDRTGALQVDVNGKPFASGGTTVVAAGADLPSIGATGGSWDESFSATGSSLAAPLVAGMLAVTAQRYPDATANQLVQSLIRNTGREPHELEYDTASGYGYGAAWLTSLLSVDPGQYPDESPLMEKTAVPTADQVAAASDRGSVYPPVTEDIDSFGEYEDDTDSSGGDIGFSPILLVAVIGGVLVVAAVVTVVIVLARRKRPAPRQDDIV